MNTSPKYFKVLADGSHLPADDPRTDHVAVLDRTRNLLIHPHSIGIDGEAAGFIGGARKDFEIHGAIKDVDR